MIDYNIMMSTISRPSNEYVFQTLSSFGLQTSERFCGSHTPTPCLVVGNKEVNYLENLKHHTAIVPMEDPLWDLVKEKGGCEKFNLNFYRCLTLSDNDVLYLEDDITFRFGWDLKLQNYLKELRETHIDFALSIYSPYDLSKSPTDFIAFDKGFYGTQGVYFTKGMKDKFAEKIMNEGVLNYRHMADLLLQEFCNDNDIPLYALKTPLIQHIGKESAIHTNAFHKAPNF